MLLPELLGSASSIFAESNTKGCHWFPDQEKILVSCEDARLEGTKKKSFSGPTTKKEFIGYSISTQPLLWKVGSQSPIFLKIVVLKLKHLNKNV